jgi:hypothetical protein
MTDGEPLDDLTRKFRANPCFFPAPKTGGGIVMPASPPPPLTPTEQAFIADTEQFEGRKLSPTKARWYVDQAKAFGDLREPASSGLTPSR